MATLRNRYRFVLPCLALAYVILAHAADTLALRGVSTPFDWRILSWRLASGPDLFKFTAWLLIPLALSLPHFDVHYFTFRRWRRVDWALLALVTLGAAGVMLILPWLPGVGEFYRGWGHLPMATRLQNASHTLLWTLSWLTGWEFTHRYFLIKPFRDTGARGSYLAVLVLVPLLEGGYHIAQGKPLAESIAMWALSILFCTWALWRKNALLPFLGHLIIELELILTLILRT